MKTDKLQWKRWPIIRHIRWLWMKGLLENHYSVTRDGVQPTNRAHDKAVLDKIWKGEQ